MDSFIVALICMAVLSLISAWLIRSVIKKRGAVKIVITKIEKTEIGKVVYYNRISSSGISNRKFITNEPDREIYYILQRKDHSASIVTSRVECLKLAIGECHV